MYEVIINLESVGKYQSFKEAFIKFFEEIKAVLDKGSSWQWLETMNFMVLHSSDAAKDKEGVMGFYDARDFAYVVGLLKDGKIQVDMVEPVPEFVSQAFRECTEKMEVDLVKEIISNLNQLHKKIAQLSDGL